jgi:predicted ribosomally synthesized peptide with nif11-like leader
MSQAEILRFTRDLQKNEGLRKEVQAKGTDVAKIVEIAKARAYQVTQEDVQAHIDAQTKALTETELDKVAGGHMPIAIVILPPPPPTVFRAG